MEKRNKTWLCILGAAATAVAIAGSAVYLRTNAHRSPGMHEQPTHAAHAGVAIAYSPRPLGDVLQQRPMITHVALHDLDDDGRTDVLACDGQSNSIRWLRQTAPGEFVEQQVGDTVRGPAHVSVADLNGDGKPDLLVASMGVILPNNDKVGSVVLLENRGDGRFENRVLLENIARVTDVRAGDFNGDGRLDLVVGQFGYVEGEIRWLENLGNGAFESHVLLRQPGTIHTPVADFDGDGKRDFAALVSQDTEAVHLFTSRGGAPFRHTTLWKSDNTGWGSSGLEVCDLNRDGKPDLLMTNGDGFDGLVTMPKWHGLQWLENVGGGSFRTHRVADFPGCYSPAAADLDGDGDLDLLAVSAFNQWNDARSVSLMAWVNDGQQGFTAHPLAHAPTHLIALAAGDLDGDGPGARDRRLPRVSAVYAH